MTIDKFCRICDEAAAGRKWPVDWHPLLKSLALDRAGDWDAAHEIAQNCPDSQGSAVHAFLHRKEGVQWNADYWYNRSGRRRFTGSLKEEWMSLAEELLG